MSIIQETPGDRKRAERKRQLREQGIKDAETAAAVVAKLVEAFEAHREHVDELITDAFIKKESPTDVVIGILQMTLSHETGGTQ